MTPLPDFAIHAYAQGPGPTATLARMLLDARDELELLRAANTLIVVETGEIVEAYERQARKLRRLRRKLERARASAPVPEQTGRSHAR